MNKAVVMVSAMILGGCAELDFGEEGLLYYEPKPYLLVSLDKECVPTAKVISLPGEEKRIKFKKGLGSAAFSVALSDGMLTAVGQTTDTKIPETLAALVPLFTADRTSSPPDSPCPSAILYPITDGIPDLAKSCQVLPASVCKRVVVPVPDPQAGGDP